MNPPGLEKTIGEGRAYLRENWEEGAACPCCSQRVKLYKRRINSGMAEILIAIARETLRRQIDPKHRPYVHVERELVRGNELLQGARDWTTLKFWNLIEPLGDGGTRRAAGEWRITEPGLWIVSHPDRPLLHEYVEVFNDRVRGRSEEKRSLLDALQRPFRWEEVAGRAA